MLRCRLQLQPLSSYLGRASMGSSYGISTESTRHEKEQRAPPPKIAAIRRLLLYSSLTGKV